MKLLSEHQEEIMKWFIGVRINYNQILAIFPIHIVGGLRKKTDHLFQFAIHFDASHPQPKI